MMTRLALVTGMAGTPCLIASLLLSCLEGLLRPQAVLWACMTGSLAKARFVT